MQVSAEIRWFWHGQPVDLKDWFLSPYGYVSAGGGTNWRGDRYLREPGQKELGIKQRDGKSVEVKGLVEIVSQKLNVGRFIGNVEIWSKWTSTSLELPDSSLVAVDKLRWLRKFDTEDDEPREIRLGPDERPTETSALPRLGCNVELTQIRVGKDEWWTFGFESFGTLSTIEKDLIRVAATLDTRSPPELKTDLVQSYPAWLAGILSA